MQCQVQASAPAVRVAALLNGLTLTQVGDISSEVRMFLWMQTFARLPETKFGQQFAAHAERADLPDGKLN